MSCRYIFGIAWISFQCGDHQKGCSPRTPKTLKLMRFGPIVELFPWRLTAWFRRNVYVIKTFKRATTAAVCLHALIIHITHTPTFRQINSGLSASTSRCIIHRQQQDSSCGLPSFLHVIHDFLRVSHVVKKWAGSKATSQEASLAARRRSCRGKVFGEELHRTRHRAAV